MDPKMMEQAFDAAQKGDVGALNLTPEETERFKKAFDDPEFCKLMADYVGDLQNPEYRAETESYISELEGENKVPAGKELVRPNPGFVAKTFKTVPGESTKGDKVFVNIVSSDKILQPSSVNSDKGQNWSLPYSVGPPHMESDKGGASATAFDVCFHPDALRIGQTNKRFRDLLVKTGIDGVQQAYRMQKQDVTLSPDFHVLKGIAYKQGQVPTMLIDKATRQEKWQSSTSSGKQTSAAQQSLPNEPAVETPVSAPSTEVAVSAPVASGGVSANHPVKHSTTVKQGARAPAIQKGFLNSDKPRSAIYPEGSSEGAPGKMPPKPLISELSEPYKAPAASARSVAPADVQRVADLKELATTRRIAAPADPAKTTGGDDKAPVYRVKERGIISMGDFEGVNKASGMVVESNRPAELVYTIDLPLVTKPSKVQLDVSERNLKLSYIDTYELSIRLPYDVFDKKGTAKYDKVARALMVTVPVKPAAKPAARAPVEEVAASSSESQEDVFEKPRTPSCGQTLSPQKKTDEHTRWVSAEQTGDSGSSALAEEISLKAKEALERHKAELASKHAVSKVQQKVADGADNSAAAEKESFISSKSFVGVKKGYCFKLGDAGLGYYIDVPLHRRSQTQPVAQPAALAAIKKRNSAFEPFKFEYRQTKEAVAVLVQIPNIIGDSVFIDFSSNGFDIAFAASGADGAVKFYSMKTCTAGELSIDKCKYDVASLNMVVALSKREATYWREDRLVDPESLSEFEKAVKKTLTQPITILRVSEGSSTLQNSCLAAAANATGSAASNNSNNTTSGAASCKTETKPTASGASANQKPSTQTTPPPPSAANKMKFTVGALLDLD